MSRSAGAVWPSSRTGARSDEDRSGPGIRSVERAARVLHAIGQGPVTGSRLTDIAASVELNKSTTHRLLAVLARAGLVEQDGQTGLFHLGYDLFVIGARAANRFGLVEVARPSLVRLAELTGDTVYLSVRSGLAALCVDRHVGSFPIKTLTLAVGDRRPLGVGAGSLALLAFLPDPEVARIIGVTADRTRRYPNLDNAMLHQLVDASRRLGYAFNDGLIIAGMSAVGVPVRSGTGEPVAAVSVAAIVGRMEPERRASVVAWLKKEAQVIEARFGPLSFGGGRRARAAPRSRSAAPMAPPGTAAP